MMKCKKCGFENPEESNFCSQCGSTLKTVCPKCGKEVSPEDSYCGGCGFQLNKETKAIKLSNENFKMPQLPSSTAKALSVVLIIASFVLFFSGIKEEGWFQDQIIGYEIGFFALSMLGVYLFNPSWFTKKKSLGLILIIFGLIIFLISMICSGASGYRIKYFKFRRIEFEEIAFSFFLLIALIIIGIGLIRTADNKISELNDNCNLNAQTKEVNLSNDKTSKPNDACSSLIPIDGKVHFETEIGGKGFALAAFVSYIGLPASILLGSSQIIFQILDGGEYPIHLPIFAIFLFVSILVCKIIAVYDLYKFAHYSFIALMIAYSIGIVNNTCVVIGYIIMEVDLSLILYSLFSICIEICLLVYFYRRKDVYSSSPNKMRIKQKEKIQND